MPTSFTSALVLIGAYIPGPVLPVCVSGCELAVAETRGPVTPVWSVCRSYMEWSHRPVLHVVLVVWIPVVSALDRTGRRNDKKT